MNQIGTAGLATGREPPINWPTGWASIGGGLLFGVPFVLGLLDTLGVSGARSPITRSPAFLALAMGLGLLLLSLYGWWSLIRDSLMGRLGIVLLAIGYGAWLVDVADNIAGTVLPFYIAEDAFAVLVALGSPLLSAGLWRTSWLPRSGLLMVGVGGPIAMGLLAAPWPLGLGPVVPALAIVYAFGWISLGAAFRRMQVQTARTRAHVEMARQD